MEKAAAPEGQEDLRGSSLRAVGTAGTVEQDDMDNGQECTQTCRGTVSRRYSLNLQMGLGHEGFDPELNAWAIDFKISESNHRSFYRRWGQLMAAESWTDLQGPPVST